MAKRKEKEFLDSDSWEQFRQEYESSDDRSCALLCAAYLDNCLEILVLDTLAHREKAKKELFSETMPLGTFSAKTKIAYCLNLIPDLIYKDLNTIRKIRNIFAHQLHGLSFSTEPIHSLCNNLLTPEDYSSSLGYTVEETCGTKPRQRFIFTSAIATSTIEGYYHQRAQKIHYALMEAEPKFD